MAKSDNQVNTLSFKRVGQDVIIWPLAKIISPEVISIGDSVIIDDFVFLAGGKSTSIGSFVHIASHTSISGGGEFVMEDFSGLSGGVRVYTGNEDYLGGSLTNPTVPAPYRKVERSFVHVGKHAIIGANSVVLPGVKIGEGAAVGANSLITRDLDPWKIYVGSPVKIIRDRPSEQIYELERLLREKVYKFGPSYIPKDQRTE